MDRETLVHTEVGRRGLSILHPGLADSSGIIGREKLRSCCGWPTSPVLRREVPPLCSSSVVTTVPLLHPYILPVYIRPSLSLPYHPRRRVLSILLATYITTSYRSRINTPCLHAQNHIPLRVGLATPCLNIMAICQIQTTSTTIAATETEAVSPTLQQGTHPPA
jgi:hypothetical protein